MTTFIIDGASVTACKRAPRSLHEGFVAVSSAEELASTTLSKAQLVAIWDALPGTTKPGKFGDRRRAVQRLWAAFAELPVQAQARHRKPREATSKQDQVIALLRRPEGATIEALMAATGWQRHTVRGAIAGALKKKLGLNVLSEKSEAGRLYRIAG